MKSGDVMNLGMISLGCAKNLVDSELFLGVARKYGMTIVNQIKDADIIVVNTCGFIQSAKKEAIDTLLEVIDYKKQGKIIIAMGCFVERYLEDLKKEIPEVDFYLPISDYKRIDELFQTLTNNSNCYQMSYKERILATPNHSAYLRIGDGCNNNCAYCAIPLIRGRYLSRPFNEIIDEAMLLAEKGVKELTLIAQDTTRYGSDLLDKPSLAFLLESLAKIEELKMIRVLYLYPDEITDELINVIRDNPKIAPYFDIPIQHISDKVLRLMNRRGDKHFLISLFTKIKKLIPHAILRTTLIVGFPGETNKDFEELKTFIQKQKFERLGVFTYSDEEDTTAYQMKNKIRHDIIQKRYQLLMSIQQDIAYQFNASRIGKVERVIIDKKQGAYYLARSYQEAPDDVDGYIYISSIEPLEIGQYYDVLITSYVGYDLKAIIKKEE